MSLGIQHVWRRMQHTRWKIVSVKREFYYIPVQDSLNVSDLSLVYSTHVYACMNNTCTCIILYLIIMCTCAYRVPAPSSIVEGTLFQTLKCLQLWHVYVGD